MRGIWDWPPISSPQSPCSVGVQMISVKLTHFTNIKYVREVLSLIIELTGNLSWQEGFGTQISIWPSCLVVEQLAANHYLPKPRGVWAQMISVKLTHFTVIKYVDNGSF